MIPEAGQKFGPYEILGRLGGGAMGLVFRAWDARLHREVAIKLLHDDYQMPGMRERFLQEARAASALNHPHICTIFDLGEQDGEPYMVMELLEGETLKEKISRGAVPTDEIISYAQEVADALAAAHAKGIVHRDVKPANIFLVDHPNGRRQAKVLDFGLAKIGLAMRGGRASRALDLTLAGATVGTLSYMSPEQARGQVLDERSDLFSLGVVMYEMATRQVPFQGATSALIFVQLLNHSPEPLHDWNDSIPKELEKIILKLLSKERDSRYQTANQLAQALRKIPFRSGGGWLKRAAAAVPLVRASDPVARPKRPARASSDPGQARTPAAPAVVTPVRPISSGDNTLIRPVVRSLHRDSGQRDVGVLRGDRTMTSQAVAEKGDSAQVEAVISQIRAEASVESEEPVVIPARSRSGVTQFEFGLEGMEAEAIADARAQVERRAPVARKEPVRAAAFRSMVEDEPDAEVKDGSGKIRIVVVAVVLAVIAVGVYLMMSGRFQPVVLQQGDALLLTVIQNRTNDKTLDGSVMEGLELALDQTQYLAVRGGETYHAGLRQMTAEGSGGTVSNHKVAQVVGAKAYLYGEIKGSGSHYTISVDVLKTDSNDKLTSIEEAAEGKEQIAAAIGRVASRIRTAMGESEHSVARTSLPLAQEASSDVEALQAYAAGKGALESGRIGDAIRSFEEAKTVDPKFTQAHLRLSWLYRAERAELSAAAEAKLAQETAEQGSDNLKLLAQFSFEMNSSGDYSRAAGVMKQFKELYPHDMAGVLGLSRVLRAQGHLPEALQAAQQVSAENPYCADAYAEAEEAMIGLDRFQDVLQLQEQAQRLGVAPGGVTLAAAYLAGDAAKLAQSVAAIATASAGAQASYGRLADYGLYLDNAGRMAAGTVLWRSAAEAAASSSARPYLLAQGALDRALTKSCSQATGFSKDAEKLPGGMVAVFNGGMASALCGDKAGAESAIAALQQAFPHSTAVTGYYVADLQAAMSLDVKDAKGALADLAAAAPYDDVSLTPYLRGLAHLASGDAKLAVADFQIIVDHRGAAFIGGSNVYPMAQIGLARAYGALGDQFNSKAAYRRFAALWQDGDHGQALLDEALAKGR